jgi:hypothetical protein
MTLFSSIADLSEESDEENLLLVELDKVSNQEAEKAFLVSKLARLKGRVLQYHQRIYTLKNQTIAKNVHSDIVKELINSNDSSIQIDSGTGCKDSLEHQVFKPIRNTENAIKLLGMLHGLVIESVEKRDNSTTHFCGSCGVPNTPYRFEFSGTIASNAISVTASPQVEAEIGTFLQTASSTVILRGLSQYSVIWLKRAKVFNQLSRTTAIEVGNETPTTLSFTKINSIQAGLEWIIKLDSDGNARSSVRLLVNDPTRVYEEPKKKLEELFCNLIESKGVYLATCIVNKIIQS